MGTVLEGEEGGEIDAKSRGDCWNKFSRRWGGSEDYFVFTSWFVGAFDSRLSRLFI